MEGTECVTDPSKEGNANQPSSGAKQIILNQQIITGPSIGNPLCWGPEPGAVGGGQGWAGSGGDRRWVGGRLSAGRA